MLIFRELGILRSHFHTLEHDHATLVLRVSLPMGREMGKVLVANPIDLEAVCYGRAVLIGVIR